MAAFGLSEPNAGSDVASIEAKAMRDGDGYVINGNKAFITNSPLADFVTTAAYTDKSEMAQLVTEKAMQIHAAYGQPNDSPIQRYFRDARSSTVAEGTSQI